MLPRKRKLYNPTSPGDDVSSYLMGVKQKLENFPIKTKMQPINPNEFLKTQDTKEETGNADDHKLDDKSENLIYTELKEELKITRELFSGNENPEKRWHGITFKFSKHNLFSRYNMQDFRMWFNPVVKVCQGTGNHDLATTYHQGSSNSSVTAVSYETTLNKAMIENHSPQTIAKHTSKMISVLQDIFDNYETMELPEENYVNNSHMDEEFVSLHLKKVESDDEIKKNVPTKAVKKSLSEKKNDDEMFESFFKSLGDDDGDDDENIPITHGLLIGTPSLSSSSKKIKWNKPMSGANYNQIITRIMSSKEQSKPPDQLTKLFQEEQVTWNRQQQKVPSKKVSFKEHVVNNIEWRPPVPVKTQPKLTNKALIELDRLNDKFKMDLNRNGNAAGKSGEKSKYYNIFNTSRTWNANEMPKLQLKSLPDKKSATRDESLQKTIENMQRHKNVPSIMVEFCRLKFGD